MFHHWGARAANSFDWADYKGKHSRELSSDTSIRDELNNFYARFEASNTETCIRASAVPDDSVIKLSAADVSKLFNNQVNIHKAAGPDGLPDVYSEHVLTNWQVSSLTFQPFPV